MQLVFSGECLDGHDPQAVRQAVVSALKLDEKRAARLFSGKRVVLRRGVDAAAALRHIARFAMMGAVLRAEPATPPLPPRPAPVPTKRAPAGRARAAGWRRPLRWAGIGVLCSAVAVALALVLGPGLNAVWPDAPPTGTAAPWAAANGPHPPPAMPAATDGSPTKPPAPAKSAHPATDDEIPKDMSTEAVREYRLGYLPAANHKAFAISSRGTHAWIAGAASENEARERALASCMDTVKSPGNGCRVVDADGDWED